MPLIVDVETVQSRMAASNSESVMRAIEAAIQSGTFMLEGLLWTSFDRATVTDTFHVQVPRKHGVRITQEFLFSYGFLATAPAVVAAPTLAGLDSNPIDLVADGSFHVAELERGMALVEGRDLSGHYVRATYTAGFELNTPAPGDLPMYVGVPEWLKEAGVHAAFVQAEMNPLTRALLSDSIDGAPGSGTLRSQLGLIVNRKSRYAPLALSPIITSTV